MENQDCKISHYVCMTWKNLVESVTNGYLNCLKSIVQYVAVIVLMKYECFKI